MSTENTTDEAALPPVPCSEEFEHYEFKISLPGKKSVLIDNTPNTFVYSKIKMKSLDIPENSYFQIREFNGRDPDKFTIEWNELFQKIKSHFQG